MKLTHGLLGIALLFSGLVHADSISLGNPSYGGTGCPGGSASVSLSPDSTALSILFDQYVAEAGGGRPFDRKNCNIAIPVHVPQGMSVSIFAIDYRGFMGLPAGGNAELSVNYFLAGAGNGVRTSKSFQGPMASDYTKSDSIGMGAIVWSGCGADTILRANTTLLVRTNARSQQAQGTVDSADVQAGLIYHLQWKSCH